MFFGILLTLGLVSNVSASAEKDEFIKIATAAVKSVINGNVNADAMMKDMERLIVLGKKFSKDLAKGNATNFMNLVVKEADNMKAMTLDEIEEAWHEGGVPTANGIDLKQFGHFAPENSAADTIIHPATCFIVLKNYKKDGDADGLDQIKDELGEVLEHIKHID